VKASRVLATCYRKLRGFATVFLRSVRRTGREARAVQHLDLHDPLGGHRFVALVADWETLRPQAISAVRDLPDLARESEPPQDHWRYATGGRCGAVETMEFDVTIGHGRCPGNAFVARVCRLRRRATVVYFANLARDEVIVFKAFDPQPPRTEVAHTAFRRIQERTRRNGRSALQHRGESWRFR